MTSITLPHLTVTQRCLFRDYIIRHKDAETYSKNPINLARVLIGDRPAAALTPLLKIDVPNEYDDADEYVPAMVSEMGLQYRTLVDHFDVYISSSSKRLDLLPTVKVMNDAFHRRLGVVLGYPPDAVERFIKTSISVTWLDLIRADIFTPKTVAYTVFVPFSIYDKSLPKYNEAINHGKQIKQRIHECAHEWEMTELDEYAEILYADAIDSYAQNGGSFRPGTSVPWDQTITPSDLELAD